MALEYLEPTSIEEAISMLVKFDGKAQIIAGGTDIVPKQIRNPSGKVEYLVDLGSIGGMDYIGFDEKKLSIGALTTIRAIETSREVQEKVPILSEAAGQLGSMAIRNQGTIGGNLCNAAPSADTAPSLIALSADARIVGPSGERILAVEDFFTGPGVNALRLGELLMEIQVPVSELWKKATYLKLGIRGQSLAVVGVAVAAQVEASSNLCKEIRIGLGAVAPTPLRAWKAEEVLRGKAFSSPLIDQCAEIASTESRPISDVRASADYRREMVKVFTRRAIKKILI